MGEAELHQLIKGCIKQDRRSQKMLYKAFYGFSMAVCLRYAADRDEAAEIMNQGFFKVFNKIDTYDTTRPFKAWLGRIMTNVSIDYYRANLKMAYAEDLEQAEHMHDASVATDSNLNYADLLAMVQRLPQSYRTVFNLFAIDGYTHEEIAEMLNINVGTSKSNLFKARLKLKQMILDADAAGNYGTGVSFTPVVAINAAPATPLFFNDKGIKGMKREKSIDDIFKHSLQNPANEPEFAGYDWDALEGMLDKENKAGRIAWLPYLSAAAAVLLIAFGWWMFKPAATGIQNGQIVKNKSQTKLPVVVDSSFAKQSQVAVTPKTASPDESADPPKGQRQLPEVAGTSTTAGRNINTAVSRNKKAEVPVSAADVELITVGHNIASIAELVAPRLTEQAPVLAKADIPSTPVIRPLVTTKADLIKSSPAFRPQLALAVIASPEINGVGSFQGVSRGTNVGMMFTIGVKKFTLSTGATYSLKPYSLPFSQYPSTYAFKTQPETVTADCRILDIPINIGYQVYNKSRNKLTLGTGVSSYIMMHESYTYDYGNASTVYGPSYYAVKGKGKYPFSVMNVQATYERQINSKFGLSLQPYYKIPLSEIGYSQVKVQTFGVAVGLNWNINSLIKPK